MGRVYYNKLIRDTIPAIIRSKGGSYSVRKLRAKEFDEALFKKLVEEAREVRDAKGKKELESEIGDILMIIDEIKRRRKISDRDIQRAQSDNLKRKGGFAKRLFLEWSSDEGCERDKQRDS